MEVQVGAKTGKLLNAKEESQQEEGKQQGEKPEKKKGKKLTPFSILPSRRARAFGGAEQNDVQRFARLVDRENKNSSATRKGE